MASDSSPYPPDSAAGRVQAAIRARVTCPHCGKLTGRVVGHSPIGGDLIHCPDCCAPRDLALAEVHGVDPLHLV